MSKKSRERKRALRRAENSKKSFVVRTRSEGPVLYVTETEWWPGLRRFELTGYETKATKFTELKAGIVAKIMTKQYSGVVVNGKQERFKVEELCLKN